MSSKDYDYLRMTDELPATKETFILTTHSFSKNCDGIQVRFDLRKGTTRLLLNIGVSNNSSHSIRDYGMLPQVMLGWNVNNTYFKGEGRQTNIDLD